MQLSLTHILLAGLVATVVMTLFSYALSYAVERNFKEPEILGVLLKRIAPHLNTMVYYLFGWVLHFAVGYLFVIGFGLVWENTRIHATVLNGVWMGALAGLVGIATWHITLKLHPNPPFLNLPAYYANLLVAHVIFGIGAALSYQ
ncbi:MAG TPA: hypothetical protein VK154_10940 [Chitinophagales bacterium]|nr:hypothetical protein [Chitinophagales bacterium]